MASEPATAIERARISLEGLSVGDAFGETFFRPAAKACSAIEERRLKDGVWRWTDDTHMALSIVEVLEERGAIDQDELARLFAARHASDPMRGYGEAAHGILEAITLGAHWSHACRAAFRGRGSFGNGAAMRAPPLGAFFACDLDRCVEEAARSAEITHAHEEGIAGAIAVAVAAALAWTHREAPLAPRALLRAVLDRTPRGYTYEGIEAAIALPDDARAFDAAKALGNGSGVTAPDTVPLCLWAAARRPLDYEAALWDTVSALGDRDTTCAIVGGIVVLSAGVQAIPRVWRERREPL